MNAFLRYLEFLSLAVWLGAIVYLSFIVAPGVFRTLPSQDQAGAVVGLLLGRLHGLGVIAGIVYLLAGAVRVKSISGLGRPGALAVIVMVVLTLVSQQGVMRRMKALGVQMGSIERTLPSNPLRAQFDRLHRVSVQLEGAVLLLGLAALFLTVREPPR
jgi:uncharacterized membrane protein